LRVCQYGRDIDGAASRRRPVKDVVCEHHFIVDRIVEGVPFNDAVRRVKQAFQLLDGQDIVHRDRGHAVG
jgi:hypothetical protein